MPNNYLIRTKSTVLEHSYHIGIYWMKSNRPLKNRSTYMNSSVVLSLVHILFLLDPHLEEKCQPKKSIFWYSHNVRIFLWIMLKCFGHILFCNWILFAWIRILWILIWIWTPPYWYKLMCHFYSIFGKFEYFLFLFSSCKHCSQISRNCVVYLRNVSKL